MDRVSTHVHPAHMAKKKGPGHFLREWRKHRDMTLEVVAEAAGITHATLSRIERGKVPYSQTLLEALAGIYRTDIASLIQSDPNDKDDLGPLLRALDGPEREVAARMLGGLKKTGT